jgi:uncharacterized protein YbjT (DUF2867 family)
MKVLLFGASGMVGQSALREALADPGVERVVSVVRQPTGAADGKLRELVHAELANLAPIEDQLAGFDACLFCIGVSAAGMSEAAYTRVTYDLTLAVATTLAQKNPQMAFIYVTGEGTDETERKRAMWARVKGRTENALRALPFRAAYMFRPGYIQPRHGIRSKTRLYRVFYAVMWPLYPILSRLIPRIVTSSDRVGRAMLEAVRNGAPPIVNTREINRLAAKVLA